MRIKRDIPFYANTPDDMRCVQACSRMILKHLLNRDFSWKMLDDLVQGGPGESTSPAAALIGMTQFRLETILVTDFDYGKFTLEGVDYIRQTYGDEVADWQLTNGNMGRLRKVSRDLLASAVSYECKTPEIDDIRKYLDEGYMVFCGLNSKIIDNEKGYRGHSVLVLEANGKSVKLHDPGLPPKPHRKVATVQFVEAWHNHGASIRAVRLPVNKPL